MDEKRLIREDEKALIHFLILQLGLNPADYPYDEYVDEYEGGKMGSISLGGDVNGYAGDLIQVDYTDADGIPVVITLTHDHQHRLLDLDFWKVDFSKLIEYPSPDKVTIKSAE